MTEPDFSDVRSFHGAQREVAATLSWESLTFSVGDKDILRNVSGLLEPGRLTAVMGPSGSGKTTLLNVLSGRQKTHGIDSSQGKGQRLKLEGDVFLSGQEIRPSQFRHRVAYVYQDSGLHPCATPRECLEFSAYLRLPAKASAEERKSCVDGMLRSLNLEPCADTIIGSELQKGISGGQQKRTAVGVELISNPRLIFLDEPLSGLDSYNAKELVASLKRLAHSGVPVLMTLHQPSSELFAKLDDIVVMHQGEVCFQGLASQLAEHFRVLGFNFPPNHNPADDVMFLIQQESEEVVRGIKDRWNTSAACQSLRARTQQVLAAHAQEDNGQLSSTSDSSEAEEERVCVVGDQPQTQPKRGCASALKALVRRELRHLRRQFPLYFQQLFVFKVIVALLFGVFFYRRGWLADDPNDGPNCSAGNYSPAGCARGFTSHFNALSLVAMTLVMESMGLPMILFFGERSTFLRESAGGYYHVIPFYLCKVVIEGFLLLIECVAMLLGSYWLVGFRAGFFGLVVDMWLMAMTSSSMMWTVTAFSKTREQASALMLIPWIMQFTFSGLMLPIQQMPVFLRWMRWLCPLYYGLGFLCSTEFNYLFTPSGGDVTAPALPNVTALLAADSAQSHSVLEQESLTLRRSILSSMDIDFEGRWWPYLGMSCVLFVLYRTLAVLILWRNSRFVV